MSVPVTTSFLVSYLPMNNSAEEWPKLIEKQGIVSILGSDEAEKGSKPSSLRRTLSADMSSKKWLAQNGFSGMKKIASSHHLAMTTIDSFSSSSSSGDEEEDHHESLAKGKRFENPPQSDIWSKIISQKAADHDDASKLPPYVHPLVKRASSLSEKSLEICTERLGSETGSDVFSSYPPSETGDSDKEKQQQQQQRTQHQEKERSDMECFDFEEIQVVKYNYATTKKSSTAARSFPPPLPSLARSEGPSVHMHSHRENGRLVLEAVAIASQNFFKAQRQHGRLLLTLVNKSPDESTSDQPEEAKVIDQFEEVFDISEEVVDQEEINERQEEEEEEMEDEKGFIETNLYRPAPPRRVSEVIYVHRSALTMKKLTGMENRNPTWPNNKFNKAFSSTKLDAESDDDQKNQTPVLAAHSLPPLPRVAGAGSSPATAADTADTATSFNSYEYFKRAKPTIASIINNPPTIQYSSLPITNNSNKAYEQKDLVLLRGNKADSLVSLLRCCKEPRRSPLSWEPHCIATS